MRVADLRLRLQYRRAQVRALHRGAAQLRPAIRVAGARRCWRRAPLARQGSLQHHRVRAEGARVRDARQHDLRVRRAAAAVRPEAVAGRLLQHLQRARPRRRHLPRAFQVSRRARQRHRVLRGVP